jgi:hypothetical protein
MDRLAEMQTDLWAKRQFDERTNGQTVIRTDKEKDSLTNRGIGRLTDRQTSRH